MAFGKDGKTVSVTLEAGKVVNGELQVKFEGIDDRDSAFSLRGYTIEIPVKHSPRQKKTNTTGQTWSA